MKTQEVCKNCSQKFKGKFCPFCGQKVITERFTVRSIIALALNQITNIEKGFWHTTKRLFTDPGQLVRDYISGKTVLIYNPFRFVLIWTTINILLTIWFGIYDDLIDPMNSTIYGTGDEAMKRATEAQAAVQDYLSLISMLSIPFYAYVSYRLFKKESYNYAEHLIGNAFGAAGVMIISTSFIPFFLLFPKLGMYAFQISVITTIGYLTYLLKDWFDIPLRTAIWKSILLYFLSFCLFMIGFLIVGTIVAIIFLGGKKLLGF